MAGHMQHPPYSVTDLMMDAIWVIAFLVSGVLCWKSNLRFRRTIFLFLLLLFLSRLLLGSGGGVLFLVEWPLLLVLFIFCIRNLFGRAKDWGEAPLAEQKAHRRKMLHRWAIAIAVIVGTGLLAWGGNKLYWVVRRATTPTIRVSAVPFSFDFVLKPGDACTFELPSGKTFALWCRTNPWFVAATFERDIGFEYGERAFERLDREEIQLPGGATTGGEYLSYIRQGSVYDGGMGNPSEYILYVEQYRISLKEKEINKHNIPMTVSVVLATEKEQVSAKDEVDYHLRRLGSADPDVQIDAMEELRMLLMLGSIYAEPRWKEIIEAIRPLSLSTHVEVKAKAVEELLVLGDEKSLLETILPEPKGKWRTVNGAISLATYSKHFGKERIYENVLPFLEAGDTELFRFAMAFFSQVEFGPVRPYMKKALQSEQPEIRLYAFRALYDFQADRDEMGRLVNTLLDDQDKEVLKEALREAGRYNDLIPPDQICKHLKHKDKEVRHMAAYALDCCRNPQVIKPLLESTHDEAATVREQAAVSLGRIGHPEAYPRLIELLKDPDATVRTSAINGLRWLGNPKAIPEIEKLEEHDPDDAVKKMARRTVRELSRP